MIPKATPATRAAAIERLGAFLPRAGHQYRRDRNRDRGPGQHSNVSGLSPYIRHRVVSESEVLKAVLYQHTVASAEKFIDEVYWRSYWKGWLEHRPDVWSRYLEQLRGSLRAVDTDRGLRNACEEAVTGRTGIEPFDAWAQELISTGYLHNHARMWFSSIWIFTLKLPWELGADFFLRHLLDGDPASNTLSWRWVAGLHTRGKTYLATADNIEKYASTRFFADGPPLGLTRLSSRADPLVEEALPAAVPLSLPEPVDATSGSGLLLTEEDLYLDAPLAPRAVALWMPSAMHPLPASDLVSAFKAEAGQDALEGARKRWPQAREGSALSSVPQIVDWARQHALEQVYMAYIPQGHLSMQVAELRQALIDVDCRLRVFVRDFDRLAWPHATKGFFQLKRQIPRMLEALGLA